MPSHFLDIASTPSVRAAQAKMSNRSYRRRGGDGEPEALTADEIAFIADRDSFYLATVSETGWPYVQHRGGPPGFLKVLDERTLSGGRRRDRARSAPLRATTVSVRDVFIELATEIRVIALAHQRRRPLARADGVMVLVGAAIRDASL